MQRISWRQWANALRQNSYALYLAGRDPRVPLLAKLLVGLVVAYALSPIDLIPDFIPVMGQLDDLVLVPLGIHLALKMIPPAVWEECLHRAAEKHPEPPKFLAAGIAIATIWLLALAGVGLLVWRLLGHGAANS